MAHPRPARSFETRHEGTFHGTRLDNGAVVGDIPLRRDDGRRRGASWWGGGVTAWTRVP